MFTKSTVKMSKQKLLLTITLTVISFATCTKMVQETTVVTTTEAAENIKMIDSKDSKYERDLKMVDDADNKDNDVNLMSVMTICNESFRIDMSYLMALNETGSFPDETDKTPKCFLRCVLQTMNIATQDDGKIDPELAAVVFAGERNGEPMEDIQEMTTYCAQRDEKCHCEMAYNFLKCLFSMEIEKYSNK